MGPETGGCPSLTSSEGSVASWRVIASVYVSQLRVGQGPWRGLEVCCGRRHMLGLPSR